MKEYYFEKKDPSSGLGIDRISLANLGEICGECITIKSPISYVDSISDDTSFFLSGLYLLQYLNSPNYSHRRVTSLKTDTADVVVTFNLSKARKLMKKVKRGEYLYRYSCRATPYERKLSNLTRRLLDGIDSEGLDKDMKLFDSMDCLSCKLAVIESKYNLRRNEEIERYI